MEVKLFQNMQCILEKLDFDMNFSKIYLLLDKIIQDEMIYAVNELKKLHNSFQNSELKDQLLTNTLIFKENLK